MEPFSTGSYFFLARLRVLPPSQIKAEHGQQRLSGDDDEAETTALQVDLQQNHRTTTLLKVTGSKFKIVLKWFDGMVCCHMILHAWCWL